VIWRYLRKLSQADDGQADGAENFQKLVKFVPVGLAIGL